MGCLARLFESTRTGLTLVRWSRLCEVESAGPRFQAGIGSQSEDPLEVRVTEWERAQVLRADQLAPGVVFVAVESHGDDPSAEIWG